MSDRETTLKHRAAKLGFTLRISADGDRHTAVLVTQGGTVELYASTRQDLLDALYKKLKV